MVREYIKSTVDDRYFLVYKSHDSRVCMCVCMRARACMRTRVPGASNPPRKPLHRQHNAQAPTALTCMHGAACSPQAAARAAAAASNKQRAAAEEGIASAVAGALHLIGALKAMVPLLASASVQVRSRARWWCCARTPLSGSPCGPGVWRPEGPQPLGQEGPGRAFPLLRAF